MQKAMASISAAATMRAAHWDLSAMVIFDSSRGWQTPARACDTGFVVRWKPHAVTCRKCEFKD
jgi:hypothetical protein